MRVLVTGAGGPGGANVIAALAGFCDLVAVDADETLLQLAATENVRLALLVPRAEDPEYLPSLSAIVKQHGVDLVHPQTDAEVEVLTRPTTRCEVPTFLPDSDTVRRCQDKAVTAIRLGDVGVPCPRTYGASLSAICNAELLSTIGGRGWLRLRRGAGAVGSLPVTSADEIAFWIRYWTRERGGTADDFILSEYLPGRDFAWQGLWRCGELVTSAVRERTRGVFSHMAASGRSSSALVAKIVHDARVNETAEAACRTLSTDGRPHGVYGVDLREDERGVPKVTEVNVGRFFTTVLFLERAGCPIVQLYATLGCGATWNAPMPPVRNACPEGATWVRCMDREPMLIEAAS